MRQREREREREREDAETKLELKGRGEKKFLFRSDSPKTKLGEYKARQCGVSLGQRVPFVLYSFFFFFEKTTTGLLQVGRDIS